ncbi:hypothetical protein GOBAR_DD00482 [Gossypium barbadense]|nr:hypothetical protein GOBAR_DD00482 [Gossypium barbadense]
MYGSHGWYRKASYNIYIEDFANAALYLASDEDKFISGVNLPIDGGYILSHQFLNSPTTHQLYSFNNVSKPFRYKKCWNSKLSGGCNIAVPSVCVKVDRRNPYPPHLKRDAHHPWIILEMYSMHSNGSKNCNQASPPDMHSFGTSDQSYQPTTPDGKKHLTIVNVTSKVGAWAPRQFG